MSRALFKPIIGLSINEKPCVAATSFFDPDLDLLHRIRSMPGGTPVSLGQGWTLLQDEFHTYAFDNYTPAKVTEIVSDHWTVYLSKMGYQIILDGSEYVAAPV